MGNDYIYEERLDENKHFIEVGDFNCGADDPLNNFLTDKSFDYDNKKYGCTYIVKEKQNNSIIAFYTIKCNGVQLYSSITQEYNSIPVIELSRIAVSLEYQHYGIGTKIFYDFIIPKIKKINDIVPIKAIIVFVDPDNEHGINFYKKLGFCASTNNVKQLINETFNEDCDLYLLNFE